jgi:nicotinate-nucleotide adenylyltransferase
LRGRLGLLGGTFDPIHVGHLIVSQDALESLRLDRLIVTPALRPPHREAFLDATTRFELVRRAYQGDGRIEVSDVELLRGGTSWSVDTLEWARTELDPDDLYLIIGADQLRVFHAWRSPDRILALARLAVMTRPGEEPADVDVPYLRVDVTRVDLSGTRVRERLREGRTVRYLVPETIREAVENAWAARTKSMTP